MSDEFDVIMDKGKKSDSWKRGLFADKIKKSGYHFNKFLIIGLGVLIPLLIIVFIGETRGYGDRWTVSCPDKGQPCKNVYHECNQFTDGWCPNEKQISLVCNSDPAFCSLVLLPANSHYGYVESPVEKYFGGIVLLLFLIAYGFNHVLYNGEVERAMRRSEYDKE
jgi:hypothetical protein